MNAVEVFRQVGKDLQALVLGPNGYFCSEGQMIVFQTRSRELPQVSLCGENIPSRNLRQGEGEFHGEFERLIDMWAGRTVFHFSGGGPPLTLQLDIGPHESKLAVGAWDALIKELCDINDTLPWGVAPGTAAGRKVLDSLATVHPAIIESQLPIFRRLLVQFLADPPTGLQRIRAIHPLMGARRVDLGTLKWLSKRPLELAGIRGAALEDAPPNPRARADLPATVLSSDQPITRYLAHLLERIQLRFAATAKALRSPAGHGVPDLAAREHARELAASVEAASGTIRILQRSPLLRSVRPESLTDSVLQSLPEHPLHSAIHNVGRHLLKPGLAYAPGQDIQSALKHSYDLFELMVLYRLVDQVGAGLGPAWAPVGEGRIERYPHEDRPLNRSYWVWRGPEGHELELHYQPFFGPARKPPDTRFFSSLSAARVPDYVVILRRGQQIASWVILDSKYRCSRQPIQDGLGDIHRYRDALRIMGRPATAAYIIVPSLQGSAKLYGGEDFIRAHRIGALTVYDQGWMKPVWIALGLPPDLGAGPATSF